MTEGQPRISAETGLISTDWLPGPRDGTRSPVVVSYTDFRAQSEKDLQEVFRIGMKLGESWPIMHGAVGLWLWGKPAEWRGGSLSVWEKRDDLQRFVRWPVHLAIMKEWRDRIEVLSESWDDERFSPDLQRRVRIHVTMRDASVFAAVASSKRPRNMSRAIASAAPTIATHRRCSSRFDRSQNGASASR